MPILFRHGDVNLHMFCTKLHRFSPIGEQLFQVCKYKSRCNLNHYRVYKVRMTIPKTYIVCGITLSSKSNLNKHIDHLNSTQKKNALNKKTHERQSSKLHLMKKKPCV